MKLERPIQRWNHLRTHVFPSHNLVLSSLIAELPARTNRLIWLTYIPFKTKHSILDGIEKT